MKRLTTVFLALSCLVVFVALPRAGNTKVQDVPKVQIALLLDNSGSMSGLLNQARSEIWTLVNEITRLRFQQRAPTIEVALYSYGDPPARQIASLTTDLDRVSEELFALSISGGSEYCGQAIDIAHDKLLWGKGDADLKLVFIAGNEPFTQGPVDFRSAVAEARDDGIVVSTIHCGNGMPADWQEAATIGLGSAASINHNAVVSHIATPHDEEISRLGREINKTYIPYGAHGYAGAQRQFAQDKNASGISAQIGTSRAVTKSRAAYSNASWDLVDAVNTGKVDLAQLEAKRLPKNMQQMSASERAEFVKKMAKRRQEIKARIAALDKKRRLYIAQHQTQKTNSLDMAILDSVRQHALKKGFTMPAES